VVVLETGTETFCYIVVSAGGRQAINASSPARTLRSVAEWEQLGVMVRGN